MWCLDDSHLATLLNGASAEGKRLGRAHEFRQYMVELSLVAPNRAARLVPPSRTSSGKCDPLQIPVHRPHADIDMSTVSIDTAGLDAVQVVPS